MHCSVDLGPWSFVFNGLDRDLVSFPIENFWDAGPPRSFCVLVFDFHRIWCPKWTKERNPLKGKVKTMGHSWDTQL